MVLPIQAAIALAGGALALSILGELLRLRFALLNRWLVGSISFLLKPDEDFKVLGSTYLIAAAFLALVLFPTTVAVAALLFTTVGDPVAAIVGERVGRRRIFRKSLEGSGAMLGAALAVAVLLSPIYTLPAMTLVVGAVIATAVEASPIPLDDNLTVPIISGGAMILMNSLLRIG